MSEMQSTPEWQLAASAAGPPPGAGAEMSDTMARTEGPTLDEAVLYVLADCFFAVGQVISMRMTIDYDAVVWWHDHFRGKFLAAMHRHGNRWLQDRENVTGVGWLLAERAVRHAAGRTSIDVEAARCAAADVERYCRLQATRAVRTGDRNPGARPRMAGYWCLPIPYPGGGSE